MAANERLAMYDMHCDFDIEQHKKTYVNYCECIIDRNGKIHYAIPSHQGFLEILGAGENLLTRQEYVYSCPEEMYCDYLTWLLQDNECVAVWSDGWYSPVRPNARQRSSLLKLISNGLVKSQSMFGRTSYSLE